MINYQAKFNCKVLLLSLALSSFASAKPFLSMVRINNLQAVLRINPARLKRLLQTT